MSSTGSTWLDPYGDDADWNNSAPQTVTSTPDSSTGLFGGQFASQQANSPGAMDWTNLGVNADAASDGTGLSPSLTLPQQSGPFSVQAAPPMANQPSPSVDYGFISKNEGQQQLTAYPSGALAQSAPATGKDPGAGIGVTIATGVDLGSHSVDDLKRWGVSDQGVADLAPAMGLKGDAARNFLNASQPLTIGAADAQAMDEGALKDTISAVQKAYDSTDPATSFSNLTPGQQTAIVDLAYQYGTNLASRTPKFWGDVTSGNWDAAVNELNNFHDSYLARRESEAGILSGAAGR